MANKYIFPDKVGEILQSAVKSEIIEKGKATVLSIRDGINETRNIEYDMSNSYYENGEYRDTNRSGAFLEGTDKIVNITFLPTAYRNEFGEDDETPELSLELCTIGININKRVVKTNLLNQKGSVKEIIGQNDYTVSISGVLVGDFSFPTSDKPQLGKPIEQMRLLIEIIESKTAVDVASPYLNNFGIDSIMIESGNLPQEIDSLNLQKFTISAYSDNSELLIL
jgi:hypothetical protein